MKYLIEFDQKYVDTVSREIEGLLKRLDKTLDNELTAFLAIIVRRLASELLKLKDKN